MEEINKKLDRLFDLIIFVNKENIKSYILQEITDNNELQLYQESDGIKTINQLNVITGISTGKISLCWDKWEKLGIMEKISVGTGGRGKRLFDLKKLGILN